MATSTKLSPELRPQLGQEITFTGILRKYATPVPDTPGVPVFRGWETSKCEPTKGIYIGYRTAQEGYISIDGGTSFKLTNTFECWMVVTGPRRNPIRVNPETVKFVAQVDNSPETM